MWKSKTKVYKKGRKTKMNERPDEMSEMGNEAEERYLTVSADWIVYGTPQVIIPDNGSLIIGPPVFTMAMAHATRTILAMHIHVESSDAEQAEGKG
jgi:hypothetical protein